MIQIGIHSSVFFSDSLIESWRFTSHCLHHTVCFCAHDCEERCHWKVVRVFDLQLEHFILMSLQLLDTTKLDCQSVQ